MSARILACFVLLALVAATALVPACNGVTGGNETNNDNSSTDESNSTNDNANSQTDGGPPDGSGGMHAGVIADHNATALFAAIPDAAIAAVSNNLRVFYGHTSHGSQLVTGMAMLAAADGRFAFGRGAGELIEEYDGLDLGQGGATRWAQVTRQRLDRAAGEINVVIWSWCGGVSENSAADINVYLSTMNALELDYPAVRFVYMTGHLDGSGADGNLHVRNQQIRDYCQANGKYLFDFADIESYDPDGNYYSDGSDYCEWCEAWCASHACPTSGCDGDGGCAHSVCFNCYRKGQAFWWLLAHLAGWSG